MPGYELGGWPDLIFSRKHQWDVTAVSHILPVFITHNRGGMVEPRKPITYGEVLGMLRNARGIKNEHADLETGVKDLEVKIDLCVRCVFARYAAFKPKDIWPLPLAFFNKAQSASEFFQKIRSVNSPACIPAHRFDSRSHHTHS